MGTSPPRLRLPRAEDSPLRYPPGTLGPLAALGVGDAVLGVDEQDVESPFEVVSVSAGDAPGTEDLLDRDPVSGVLRIVIRTGAYRSASGTYEEVRVLTLEPRA